MLHSASGKLVQNVSFFPYKYTIRHYLYTVPFSVALFTTIIPSNTGIKQTIPKV